MINIVSETNSFAASGISRGEDQKDLKDIACYQLPKVFQKGGYFLYWKNYEGRAPFNDAEQN